MRFGQNLALMQQQANNASSALEVLSITVDPSGFMISIQLSAPTISGVGGRGGFTLDMSGSSIVLDAADYVSGEGTNLWTYESSRAIEESETGTADYIQPGDGLQNESNEELESFSGRSVINDSLYNGDIEDVTIINFTGSFDFWQFRRDITIPAEKILETGNFYVPITPAMMGGYFLNHVQDGWKDFRPVIYGTTTALAWRTVFMDKGAEECFAEIKCAVTAATEFKLSIYFGNPDTGLTSTATVGDFATSSPSISHWFDTRKNDPAYGGDWKAYTLTGTAPVSAGMQLAKGFQWPARDGYLSASSIFFGAANLPNTALAHVIVPVDASDLLCDGRSFVSLKSSTNPSTPGQRRSLAWTTSASLPVISQNIGSTSSIIYAIPDQFLGTESIVAFGSTTNSEVSDINNWKVYLVNGTGVAELVGTWVNQPSPSTTNSLAFGGTWHISRNPNDTSPTIAIGKISALRVFESKAITTSWLLYQWDMYYNASVFCTKGTMGNDLFYQGIALSFTLSETQKTTGEVVEVSTGKRIRRVWGGLTFSAGSHTIYWDKKDDRGNLMPVGNYTFRLLPNNVSGNWDGVIANSSFVSANIIEGPNPIHRGLWHYEKIAFTGDGDMHIAPGTNEGQPRGMRCHLSDIQSPIDSLPQNYRYNVHGVACDATTVYYLFKRFQDNGADPKEYAIGILALDSNSGSSAPLAEHSFGGANAYLTMDTITEDPTIFASGIAVQQLGNYFFGALGYLDELRVYSKTDKSLVATISVNNIWKLDVDSEDNPVFCRNVLGLWNVSKLINIGTTNDIVDIITGLAQMPLDIAIRPAEGSGTSADDDLIALYVGGEEGYIQFYDGDGTIGATLGEVGGIKLNGPNVNDTRFDPIAMKIDLSPSAWLSFDRSGRLWLGDNGNCRILVHDAATFAVVDSIYPGQAFYMFYVDQSDPTRAFRHWLEYTVSYDALTEIENSWTLARNWRYHTVPKDADNTGLLQVKRFDDGLTQKTLAIVIRAGSPHSVGHGVLILPDDGTSQAVYTGKSFTKDANWDHDGSILWLDMDSSGTHNLVKRKAFVGFDSSGIPEWDSAWTTIGQGPKGAQEPDPKQLILNGFSSYNTKGYQRLADGTFVVYRNGQNASPGSYKVHHLGFIAPGGTTYAELSMTGAKWNSIIISNVTTMTFSDGEGGTFDDNTSVVPGYAGNKISIAPGNTFSPNGFIAVGYHGEFWEQGQAGQVLIFDQRGTYIMQIGQAFLPTQNYTFPRPRMAGNNFGISFVKVSSRYFIWFNDEGGWSSPHRWEIIGLDDLAYMESAIEIVA